MNAFDEIYGLSFTVRISQFAVCGHAFLFARGTLHPDTATLLVRHWAEYALLAAGATWHPEGERCPTWTDECRCMLGGEA